MKPDQQRVKIFDTTLRDGQQCPGAGMSYERNLEYAHLARGLGIDVLEAGFPSASAVDFRICRDIAAELAPLPDSPIVAGLCQLREEQIDVTIEALQPAVKYRKARLHTYVPVDPELMLASLGEKAKDRSRIQRDLHDFCTRAVAAGLEVEFSPEGYSRMGSNFDFVTELIYTAVDAGASVINCPDTIGGACRLQGESYFVEHLKQHAQLVAKRFPGRDITWSCHCHNDFGLALENSLNAVFFGPCRQIEGCINGIGERAGNVSLEQCIMVIKHFAAAHDREHPLYTGIRTERLQQVSDFVDRHMLRRQSHQPIGGENAARHSSGGHTNAILSNPLAYQPFDPKEVGKEISIVFGPLSGGNHAQSVIEQHGYLCGEEEKTAVAGHIKRLYHERRKGITDQELLRGYIDYRRPIKIDEFDYSKSANRSQIFLKGEFFGTKGEFSETHEGKDSALAALKKAIDSRFPGFEIQGHRSNSDGEGINAVSVSTIYLKDSLGNLFQGEGRDQDIEISAMKALIDAANIAYVESKFRKGSAQV